MTSGTLSKAFNVYNAPLVRNLGYSCGNPGSSTSTTYAPALWGMSESKSWSGTDRPKSLPIYDRYYYTLPTLRGRRQFYVKQRRRIPAGDPIRKELAHPYTMSFSRIRSVIAVRNNFVYQLCGEPLRPTRFLNYVEQYGTYERYGPAIWTGGTWTSNHDIALIGKLREKVAGTDFDMTVFLGEGRESLAMIFKSATTIRRTISELRHGNVLKAAKELGIIPKKAKRVESVQYTTTGRGPRFHPNWIPPSPANSMSDRASSIWLQWSYGWKPLLSDTYNAVTFLAKLLEAPMVQEYRVSLKLPKTATHGQNWVNKVFVGYSRKRIIAQLTEVNVPKLLGFTDPAAVVWELVPWSFVVDWFIPVGNYLQARGLASSLTGTFVTSYVVRTYERCTGLKPSYDSQGLLTNSYLGDFYTREMISLDRTVSTTLSVPIPSFKPLADVPSWQRAANATALLLQVFLPKGGFSQKPVVRA